MRINAEDPARGLRAGAGHGRRASARRSGRASASTRAVEDGLVVPPYYDSLIAKLIVWDDGPRRPRSRARCARSRELEIEGVPTTREAALEILASEEFASGDYDTSSSTGTATGSRRWWPREPGRLQRHEPEGTVTITSSRARPGRSRRAAETVDGVAGATAAARDRPGDLGRSRARVARADRAGTASCSRTRPASVQERVAAALEATCGLGSTVDVTVEEIT